MSAAGAPAGTCYGFAVESSMTFDHLRPGHGAPLRVEEDDELRPAGPSNERPLLSWNGDRGDAPDVHLYGGPDQFRLWIDGSGWYTTDTTVPAVAVPPLAEPVRREQRLWGLPAMLCSLARGDLPLHAAAAEIDGRAVLFTAPSRHGKSTLAAALLDAGHRVLAEDVACIRLEAEPTLLPGPAGLRLRRDTYGRLAPRHATVVLDDGDRFHLTLDPAVRGDGAPVPIRAVVVLAHGEACQLTPIDAKAALRDLWVVSFNLPTSEDRARCFGAIAELADRVPVFRLSRPFQFHTLPTVVEFLERSFSG